MIRLQNKPNVISPNPAYPYGALKDDTGADDGTPVDKEVYDDIHQFIEKMVDESGITTNGLPDNETNGFEIFEALEEISNSIKHRGNDIYTTTDQLAANTATIGDPGFPELRTFAFCKKFQFINMTSGITSFIPNLQIASLGEADFGTQIIMQITDANYIDVRFVLNSTHLSLFPTIKVFGNTTPNDVILIPSGTEKNYRFTKFPSYWRLEEI